MAKVRVLRLIEYVYEDAELALVDQTKWTNNLNLKNRMVMTSATLPATIIEDNRLWCTGYDGSLPCRLENGHDVPHRG